MAPEHEQPLAGACADNIGMRTKKEMMGTKTEAGWAPKDRRPHPKKTNMPNGSSMLESLLPLQPTNTPLLASTDNDKLN